MTDHLYRTTPEVCHVSDTNDPGDFLQDLSVCAVLNQEPSNDVPGESHRKSSDTQGTTSGLSVWSLYRYHTTPQAFSDDFSFCSDLQSL